MTDYFCGISKIPKGKRLGTAEECMKSRQVRYWGIDKIPKKVKEAKSKKREPTLTEETLKLKALGEKAKKLVKDVKKIKLEIEKREERELRPLKTLDTKLNALLKRRDTLVKQIKKQSKLVEKMEEQEAKLKKKSRKK